MQKQDCISAIFFLALAVFFFTFALFMEPGNGQIMLFAFAGIDFAWGICKLVYIYKNRNK